MGGFFYRALFGFSRVTGLWLVRVFAWFVSTGYFFFKPGRVAISYRFYKALFPERGFLFYLGLSWRQFHRFAGLFAERLRLERGGRVEQIDEGWEKIATAAASGVGGILLMSHVGNWEIAAHLFRRKDVKLMLFMGARQKEQVERLQKDGLMREGVEVVIVSEDDQTAFNPLDGLRFIKSGGVVSFAGDRLWSGSQREVQVTFLGHQVKLPAGPYLFALATKVPIFTFFALKTARFKYHLVAHGPHEVKASSRADRWPAVQRAAQQYADRLEKIVRRFPSHWYHFEQFLGPAKAESSPDNSESSDQVSN